MAFAFLLALTACSSEADSDAPEASGEGLAPAQAEINASSQDIDSLSQQLEAMGDGIEEQRRLDEPN